MAATDDPGTAGAPVPVSMRETGENPGAALTRALASDGLMETRVPGTLEGLNAQTAAFRPMTASDLLAQLANGEPELDPRNIRALAAGSTPSPATESGSMPTAPGNAPLGKGYGSLDIPLNQPGWDQALGNRVRWMLNEKLLVAELKLNPPNLGVLEIRVQQEGDRTSIQFIAPQAAVRDAVDGALQRLRDLFQESGLNLGDVTVSQQGGGEGNQPGRGNNDGPLSLQETDGEGPPSLAGDTARPGTPQGLVDYYA
jgi:flagellar hook-length control protein FliK